MSKIFSPLKIKFLFYIGLLLIYNVLVSAIQQTESIMHIRASFFQILFPFRLLENIEQDSLCYTVGPCWLSILNIVVCICQSQTPNLFLSDLFALVTISLFSTSDSVSIL